VIVSYSSYGVLPHPWPRCLAHGVFSRDPNNANLRLTLDYHHATDRGHPSPLREIVF